MPARTRLWMIKAGRSLLSWTAARVRKDAIQAFLKNMPAERSDWRAHRRQGLQCVRVLCVEVDRFKRPRRRRDGLKQLALPLAAEVS